METKELIQKYIKRTNISEKDSDNYHMTYEEFQCMYNIVRTGDIFGALLLTFEYGRAKGCRLAKRRARHG